MAHRSDADIIAHTNNTARYFTQTRHVAWVLLVATCLWGVYGFLTMPQRKDPDVPVRLALTLTYWPGASSEKVEELVTRRIEETIAKNPRIEKLESVSRTGLSAVYITLDETVKDRAKEFDDIKLKLDAITTLPDGAGPIQFIKDFADTAALMLTVASPKVDRVAVELRAAAIKQAIEDVRRDAAAAGVAGAGLETRPTRLTIVQPLPSTMAPSAAQSAVGEFIRVAMTAGVLRDARTFLQHGFVGIDGIWTLNEAKLADYVAQFIGTHLRPLELHPDAGSPIVVADPAGTLERLSAVAGDRYTYRELDDFTDLIARTLRTQPIVAKVDRSGVLNEQVTLEYSQERLASYGVTPSALRNILGARNITLPGGTIEAPGKSLNIDPSGEFADEREIGDVLVPTASGGGVYLRDLATVVRSYTSPPNFLNYYGRRDPDGNWQRTRAVTLAVQMKSGGQIGEFSRAVDAALEDLRARLPNDLVLARTSDQPTQVREHIELFMGSLEEAIVLVVIVSLIGFWEWRSALLMALSIPITLAMTFGLMQLCGIDVQQVSIASLIIALGLLVDDPVVAGDAIKRELAAGHPPLVAAWLGPTKLASAILYATITNIVAYLPFLLIGGDSGQFIYSLPVVITCSLIASRLVSMTFIPLLGFYLLKSKGEKTIAELRQSGFASFYYRFGRFAIAHRWGVLSAATALLVLTFGAASTLKTEFFPKDEQYLSFVDIFLPEDAPLSATRQVVAAVEAETRRVAEELERDPERHSDQGILKSLTTFLGGGGPRYWYSSSPELQQTNYAQVLIEVNDKHETDRLVVPLQRALSAKIPGALIDVRKLELTNVGVPLAIRLSGDDAPTLRRLAARVHDILNANPMSARVRDDWGAESFEVKLATDPDRANLTGVTNLDVAASTAAGLSGSRVGLLRDRDKEIPIVAKLRMDERAQLDDVRSLYVYANNGTRKVPLESVASVEYGTKTEKLRRRGQFRTITVSAFPAEGYLPSEVLNAARPELDRLAAELPPGYRMAIGGEHEEQVKSFRNQARVMMMSTAMIFLALVIQFRHAAKPFIVFAGIPFGIAGALAFLVITGTPFGFMAFLGIASLIGVIVSHVVVLFDFIEEAHERGESLEEALLDAGVVRLRPVLITVAATVIALIPLAMHGGPLWVPMCYAQIGGLTVATFVTLVLVPVIYAIFVKDLKLVKWGAAEATASHDLPSVSAPTTPAVVQA
jgi:multidrug efflux pump subunit AcrB